MNVVGIAGLPGSGKSGFMKELKSKGYACYDDINVNWDGNLPRVRAEIQNGKSVAVSDIMFCDESWRRRLENELGAAIQWVFFENNPWQCAKNSLYRFIYQKPDRPLQREIDLIRILSKLYVPQGEIRKVALADESIPPAML